MCSYSITVAIGQMDVVPPDLYSHLLICITCYARESMGKSRVAQSSPTSCSM